MKVFIDGTAYVPLKQLSSNGDSTARAIIHAFVSGYYHSVNCNVDGYAPKDDCKCSACHIYRVAIQFIGEEPECESITDAGFQTLMEATKK